MVHAQIENRADPDILLSAISKKSGRKKGGRLFLYIGMAPGVGKTYAMLLAAKDAQKNGIDCVVGVVESHGRKETEQLLVGLSIIPRKSVLHKDREFLEMDLDAILKRKPALVLVDELAHTNMPGCRHAKRWQDVFELLDAGIDVYSTLNVQHLESRKDSVEKIANIFITETVPDSVLDRAFQIQLIDLSSADLIRRLKEGKIYLGDKAELAAANFFKEEKLTALREIALRVAAERVDAELKTYADVRESGSTWPVAERLMVAVGHGRPAEKLIRTARRMAYNLEAPWVAVHISVNELIEEEDKALLKKNLDLARNLGAEVVILADANVVEGLIRIAQQKDISQIIVGRSQRGFFRKKSVFQELVARSSIDICVVSTQDRAKNPWDLFAKILAQASVFSYLKSFLFTGMLIVLNWFIAPYIGYRAVGFLLLVGILAFGLFMPIGSVLLASIITMVGWNFFFIPPIGTFHIQSPDDMFLSLSYLFAALTTGILAYRNRYQQEILIRRELCSQSLNNILLDIATKTTVKDICDSVVKKISSYLSGECDVVLLKKDKALSSYLGLINFAHETREMAVAKWAIENNKLAGSMTETLSSAEALYVPLKGSFEMMGALAFKSRGKKTLSVEDMDFLCTVAHQLGLSLEKLQFRSMALSNERLLESEKFHQTLLDIVVREVQERDCSEQENAILKFHAENCLIVSRLLVGIFPLHKQSCGLKAIIQESIKRVKAVVPFETNITIIARDHQLLSVEFNLMAHAFANIILNGVQHDPEHSLEIEIDSLSVSFMDNGAGVPEEDLGRIFEKFYRFLGSEGHGLGLALAKGVIKAHEGKIIAKNRPSGGFMVKVSFTP